MKQTLKIVACLSAWLALVVAGHAQNNCVNTTNVIDSQCLDQGTVNTLGVLSYTNLVVCVGQTITAPTATDTTFNSGSCAMNISNSCPDFSPADGWVTNYNEIYADGYVSNGTYINTNVYYVPPIPLSLDTVTNFQSTAYVDGVDPLGYCSNIIGIVLGTVNITCYGPPAFTLQPISQTVGVGSHVTFASSVTGSSPLTYQWYFNGTNLISGATNQTLILTNVVLSQAGSYDVIASNTCGTVTSSNAVLTVFVPTCITPPSGLVAWWQFESNVLDNISNYNGTASGITYTNGEVSRAIYFDGTTNSTVTFGTNVANFGTNDFAVEFWLRTTSTSNLQACIEKRGICNAGHFWDIRIGTCASCTNSGAGHIIFELYGCPDRSACGNWLAVTAPTVVNDGVWHHVACVRTGSNSLVYVDGKLDVSGFDPIGVADVSNTSQFRAGQNICQCCDGTVPFKGNLDELALYNRALTTNDIQAIYNAGIAGKCVTASPPSITQQPTNQTVIVGTYVAFAITATGTLPLNYQWQHNGSNITGATNASYSISNVQTNDAGTYVVIITNVAGSVTSSNAVLTVLVPPTITQQPTNQTVIVGTNVAFSVTATGTLPLNYQWQHNGSNITGATNASYSISNVQTNDGGTYDVIVTNIAGSVTSTNAVLTVLVPPTITQQPTNQTVIVGTNVAFAVTATGTLPLHYQWRFGGTDITGATNASYTIMKTIATDAGSYSVVVTNIAGSVTSSNAVLTVLVPPSITQQPTNQTIIVGSNAVFAVAATGTLPLNYQWRLNGANITGATNASYTINSAHTNDAGSYSALVTNIVGTSTSANAILTVLVPPTITQQPTNQTVIAGMDVAFTVTATGTLPLNYQWQHNGSNITGATNASYSISNVQTNDAGTYVVIITNVAGSVTSSNAVLTVLVPPTITQQPTNQTVIVGTNVAFSVTATGTLPLNYQWQHNGSNITGATNASYSISNVQTNDGGTYDVIVTNIAGSVTSTNAVLTVLVPPTITQQPTNQTVIAGTNVAFVVTATGTLPLNYQWQHNGSNITGATNASYSISNVQTNDAGTYVAIITNVAGSVTSSNAVLTVLVPPAITQQPTNQTVIVGTNVAFAVTATGTLPLNYQWQHNGSNITGATNASYSISNVQTNDAGTYRVIVTNVAGSVTSTNAVLTVLVPPQITSQPHPATQTLLEGTNGTIALNASGTAPLSYQWRLNGANISGANQSAYSITNAQTSDGGNYLVVITNVAGAVTSSVATVAVIIPPTIVAQPTNTITLQGSNATFSVSANGTTPLSYQWLLNGTPLNAATNAAVTITNCQSSNAGSYSVIISNVAGVITSSNATLTVLIPPSVTGPQSTNVVEGSSAGFTVSASGTMPLLYQWRFNGANISGATSNSYRIAVVQPTNQGSYSVVVTNVVGSVTSSDAVLTVTIPPGITNQPIDQVIPQGTTASFAVAASGSPTLMYQWYTNGVPIVSGTKYAGTTSSTLWVSNAVSPDAVVYSVAVSNSGGSVMSSGARLSIVGTDRIIVNGSIPEISVSATIALGSTIVLQAVPSSTPSGLAYPTGYPVWSASYSTLAMPGSGSVTATITPTNAGIYTIWASCGNSNSFTLTVNSTNDVNYDGIVDSSEDPNNPPQLQLGFWSFDTLDLAGLQGQRPLSSNNVALVGGWSILAAQIDSRSNGPTVLSYRESETNAVVSNINLRRGTVRFLFNPNWSSTTAGGTGPQNQPRLIEVGDKSSSSGCWGLYLDPSGTNATFCSQTNGGSLVTNFTAAVNLTNATWYQFDLTYSATNAALYLNGNLITNNAAGLSTWPGPTVRANGFRIGGGIDTAGNGTNTARGNFDNLETYNYAWGAPAISNYFKRHPQPIATNVCGLAPIALFVSTATTLTNGQIATTTNNAGAGNFAWLSWNSGNSYDLAAALTNWAWSQTFTNAENSSDTTLSTGDWIWGNTGWQVNAAVSASLNWLTNTATNFGVVLWNQYSTNQHGNNLEYEAAEYAKIQLLDYDGSSKTIKYKYLGLISCDSYSNQPPVTQILTPTNNQIFTVLSNGAASVPITALGYDPENNLKGVNFYWGTNDAGCTNFLGLVTNATDSVGGTNEYSLNWPNALHGTNSIETIAFDELAQTGTSQVCHIIVNWQPTLVTPNITNVWVEGAANLTTTITGTAWDDGLPYGQTNFLWTVLSSNGPVTFGNATNATTTVSVTTNGTYRLQLAVNDGVASTSSQCVLTVLRRPFVSITSPASNATVLATPDIAITANAYGYDESFVTNVQFFYAFNGITNPAGPLLTNTTYVCDWTNAPVGTNMLLIAIATDNYNLAQTSSIPVNVGTTTAVTLNSASNCPGTTITFAPTVAGTGPFTYAWSKDGGNLAQTNASLTIANVASSDAGVYTVVVAGYFNTTTNSATLTVWTNVGVSLLSLSNCPGTVATFIPTVTGNGPFTYNWKKDGANLGQIGSTLSISNVSSTNAGLYTVEVTGLCSSATNSATLTVWTNVGVSLLSLSNCPGTVATFSPTVTGTGPFTYNWKKDGSNLGQTNSSLSISNVSTADAGSYIVEVTGPCSSGTNTATLTVWTNVGVTLASLSNCPETVATFIPTVTGNGPFTYNWKKDGANLGQIGSTLSISNVSSTNAGFYTVEVNGLCSSATNSATLTVWTNVAASLLNLSNCPGAMATFIPTVTGTGPFTYNWKKDGSNLGQIGSTLTVSNICSTNAGSYTVEVTGLCSSATNSATLTVWTNVGVSLLSLSNCPGTVATFIPNVTGTGPFTYNWKKDGSNLGQTNSSLNISNVSTTDAGLYLVEVTGPCSSATNTATLTVFTNTTVSIGGFTNCPGTTVTFLPSVGGTGPFSYTWKKDGANLGQTNSSLSIPNVTSENAGLYTVEVSGYCGNATNSGQLVVSTNTFAAGPTNLSVLQGDNATFTTSPSGSGLFSFVWRKDAVVIAGATTSSLIVANVTPTDSGTYAVEVTGACGTITNFATLDVDSPPSVVIVTPVNGSQEPAPARIQLTSAAHDDHAITNVVYTNINGVALGSSSTSPFAITLTNLLGGTNVFRAVAYDNRGQIGVSPFVTNVVIPQPPQITILNPTNGEIFAAPATIRIKAEPFDPDGIVTNVDFFSGMTKIASVTNAPFFLTLTNIAAGTYTFGATAQDNDGLTGTAGSMTIIVQTCVATAVNSFVLSTNEVTGGTSLTGAITLAAPAMTGGQVLNLSCDSSSVKLPATILVPQGDTTVNFSIDTLLVGSTNAVTVTCAYHSDVPVGAALTILPYFASTNVVQGAVRPGFDANIVVPCGGDGDPSPCGEDGSIGLVDIGFPISFYSQEYSNLWVNMNGNVTFTAPYRPFTPQLTIQGIGLPAIAPFWADVDPRGTYDTNTFGGTMKYGTNTVDGHLAFGVTWDNVGYYGAESDLSNRFQVVLIDRSDKAAGDFDIEFNYDRVQWETGEASSGTDGFGGHPVSIGFGDGLQSGFNFQGSGVSETFVDTNFVSGLVHNSYNSPVLGRYLFSVPFPVNKQIVVVRDDLEANNYTGFATVDAQRTSSAKENAGFDLRAVSGTVLAAEMQRTGQLRRNVGTHYDFEWGIGSTKSSLNSFGPIQTDAQALPIYYTYDFTWNLPAAFYSDIGLGLNSVYNVQLTDRITSLCGNTVQLEDLPNANWPSQKNILTFLISANPDIPQGRCRDIVLSGVNQFDISDAEPAFNGAWDIVLNGQIIASSGQKNGWSVERDYTDYGGINVAPPSSALAASGYEVRLASQSSRTSGFFSLVSSNTLNSAPVLLPLQISSKVVTNGVPVTVTVALDAPATGKGAIVSLKWDGASGGTIPTFIAIPAGQRTNQFTFLGQTNAAFTNFTITASYNGYRKGSLYVVPSFGVMPSAPTNLTAAGQNGQVVLTWAHVDEAQTYNVKRSTIPGGPYVRLFEDLSTTNYVDTQVNNGTTYYYVVSAVNVNGESVDSAEASATPQIPITTATPVIAPNGGAFNDEVQVQITDATGGADIWYTVDGTVPVNNSPSLHYTAPFTLTSDATIRARAYLAGAKDSSVASASFRIFGTTPLACGTTNSDSLSLSSSFSTNRGVGYFVGRYSFTAVAGEQVTINLTSTNFDTYLYLVDPKGRLVAQNDDANGSTNSQIIYNTKTAGSYYVEATSAFPAQIGAYQISLACVSMPEIGVLSGGIALSNRAIIDFGVTNTSANISKTITITNLGSTNLIISNLTTVPSGSFTISPTSLSPISPAHSADLTVTFNSSTQGQFNSALSIVNNDQDGRDGMQNPVIINLTAHANIPGTAPKINITAPTSTQSFTAPAQVTISANVTQGDSAISNVVFYLRTAGGPTIIGADSTAPYSVTWTNVAGGNYTIYAVVTDVDGRLGVSADASFFVNSPPVAGAVSATVPINSITNAVPVLSNDSDPDGDTLTITDHTPPGHGTVTLVGNVFYYTPAADYVGIDSFTYTISDGHGGIATGTVTLKVPPSTLPAPPIAQITSPVGNDRITAPTTITGTAQSAYLDNYELQIRPAGHDSTPWKTFATGNVVVNGGPLGVLDPTLMLNGSYDIQLLVADLSGQETTSDIVTIAITGSMKVGAFSISFPDLNIPVGGLPITLVRTYDSRNQDSGDFGASWTLDVNSVHLDKNMSLGENWFGGVAGILPPEYYLEDDGPHLITITFPDGTVQRFQPVPLFSGGNTTVPFTPEGQYVHFKFQALPGTQGYLSATGLNDLVIPVGAGGDYTGEVTINEDGNGYGDGPIFDASEFTYTTLDGRTFQFNASGKIVKMSDLNGNTLTFNNAGIIHSSGKSVKFVRDAANRITSIYDPNGLDSTGSPVGPPVLIYKYDDPLGNLKSASQLTDRSAGTYVTTTFSYTNLNFPHYLTDIHDPRGVTISRQLYDDTGRLIGTVDAGGNTNMFSYDLNARTAKTSDALGNWFISTYDSHGNVTNTIDVLQRQTSQTFDDDDNLTSTTDALHHTTYYNYDSQGNQTSVIDALGNANLMGYDKNNNLTALTNALGNVTQFQYDSHGNQTNIIDALGHSTQAVYDTNGHPISVTDSTRRVTATGGFDPSGYLTNVTEAASGVTTAFAHDANGNQTASTNVWINPNNSADVRNIISQSVFDAQNRETTKTDPDGSQSTVSYDPDGRQSQLANQYNRTAYWKYDAQGNLIEIGFPDGTITRMAYDAAGRMTATDKKHFQGTAVNGTRTTYDAVGQVIKLEQLSNIVIDVTPDFNGIPSSSLTSFDSVIATSTYGYDLTGRQNAVTNNFGAVTRYEYDAVGHQTAVIDALTNRTDYVYDQAGHLVFTTNALHQVTQNVYDALGRRVQTIYPDNSYSGVAYDDAGNRVAQTNRLGLVTTYGYDDVSRMTNIVKPSVFDPETNAPAKPTWGFTYNTYGQLKSTSDPKNHVTQFTYDQLGRVLTHTLPMNNLTASQIYDSNGRPSRQIDFKGQTNELIYDSIGRLATNQFYAVGSATPNVFAAYTYDSEDRQKQIVESRGTSGFTYDDQGNVTQIAMPEGTLNYEYEPIGNRLVRTYTINSDLRYGYDLLGRISTVTVVKRNGAPLTTPEVTTNTYTALGSLQDVYYPNGIHAAYQYDGLMNRLTNLTYTTGNNSLLAQYQYSAGVTGQWKTGAEILLQKNGTSITNQLVWNYDNAGRLTNEACSSTVPARSYTNLYVYNLVGNRLWTTNIANTGTTVTGCSYNDNDQLLQEVTIVNGSTTGTFTNSYDQNGSLTNHSSETELNSYSYNLQNKLTTAVISRTDGGHQLSETISFTYDFKGNRVQALWSRSVDSGAVVKWTNYFLNDSKSASGLNRVLEEFPSIGATPTASYTLGGRILSQSKNGTNSHLLPDGHGSTRQLADLNGNIAEAYTYDAYGKGLDFTNGALNPTMTGLLYSGEQLDADLQLYDLRARYYNPAIARFNQIDPFAGNQTSGNNLYAYGAEDPVNNSDPTGMYEVDVHQFLTEYLADHAGYGADAVNLGQTTQNLDLDNRDAMFGGVNHENMRLYHFVSKEQLASLRNEGVNGEEFDYYYGEYLHALEDTYAHCTGVGDRNWNYIGNVTWLWFTVKDNGGEFGHGHLGHEPDHTYRDPDKGMKMAETVYSALKADQIYSHYPQAKSPDDWTGFRDDIDTFMHQKPNVYKELKFGVVYVENATFSGYNDKIKKLNTDYKLASSYKEGHPPQFSDEKGFVPSKTVAGAVTRAYILHGVADVIMAPLGFSL